MAEKSDPSMAASLAMIGLGVMGANLARNMERNGYTVAVYDRTAEKVTQFREKFGAGKFRIASSVKELVDSMSSPRAMFVMVPAGGPVDAVIEELSPLLNKGDMIIDGGNSHFPDTVRREKYCAQKGIAFLGVGVSGGEEGALKGASIMPGGPKQAWERVAKVFEKMAAFADGPCTTYIGPDGSGHFVKMVHNGIEYGDMQLIAEAYHLLSSIGGLSNPDLAKTFKAWNKGVLGSFLIEITGEIFDKEDDRGSGGFLVDKILDKAGQKGTGKWTSQVALDLGVPIPTITAAVDARCLSALKSERKIASGVYTDCHTSSSGSSSWVTDVHDALYASKVIAYAQGMSLLSIASREWNWGLKLEEIAAIWKGGCIIRAKFLDEIRKAYKEDSALPNLLLAPSLREPLLNGVKSLRKVVATAASAGVPCLGFAASLAYFDSYVSERLPQNLTQAQRDFFGAHTYERVDMPGSFHSAWS